MWVWPKVVKLERAKKFEKNCKFLKTFVCYVSDFELDLIKLPCFEEIDRDYLKYVETGEGARGQQAQGSPFFFSFLNGWRPIGKYTHQDLTFIWAFPTNFCCMKALEMLLAGLLHFSARMSSQYSGFNYSWGFSSNEDKCRHLAGARST